MSIRKRNEFLDDEESNEEVENDYDSEAEPGRGAIGRHTSKRRKIESDAEQSSGSLSEDEHDDDESPTFRNASQSKDARFDLSAFDDEDGLDNVAGAEEGEDEAVGSDFDRIKAEKQRASAAKQASKSQKLVQKSGVIYISRVPPFMKPQTLRHLLAPHAPKGLGRIFLTPEDNAAHSKRVKNGGNKKKSYTDGWVEFTSKRAAQRAAQLLNGNIIGGKKGNFYHDDLWNMKYLKGFKWHHLTEQVANENAERSARMREEIRRSRRENRAFVEDVERAKMLNGMDGKRAAKRLKAGLPAGAASEGGSSRPAREFRQWKAHHQSTAEAKSGREKDVMHKALRKVF